MDSRRVAHRQQRVKSKGNPAHRCRERIRPASWRIRDEIVRLRGLYRDRLLRSEKLTREVGERLRNERDPQRREALWATLERLATAETFFLGAFQFISYADGQTLTKFALNPAGRRAAILSARTLARAFRKEW